MISRRTRREELITAIRAVAPGHVFVPSAMLHELADTVLMLTCRGLSAFFGRARNRTEAVAMVYRRGIMLGRATAPA
jgi:hypothetical protein